MSSSATNIRHDWYQTDEKVVVTVLIKNVLKHNVDIQTERVILTADDYTLDLALFKPIVVDRSSHRISPVKIEITLAKVVGERWPTLTFDKDAAAVATIPTTSTVVPSSTDKVVKMYKHDWDQLEKQVEKDDEAEKKEVRGQLVFFIPFLLLIFSYFIQTE